MTGKNSLIKSHHFTKDMKLELLLQNGMILFSNGGVMPLWKKCYVTLIVVLI